MSYKYYYCSDLNSIELFDGLINIDTGTFSGCSSLTSIELPDNLVNIKEAAFYWCNSLTSIELPSGLTDIEASAFSGCNNLTDIYCYAKKVPNTGDHVFDEIPLENVTLHVPASAIDDYANTSPWNKFGFIVALPKVIGDIDDDGKLTVSDITLLIEMYLNANNNSQVTDEQSDDTTINDKADLDGDGQLTVGDITMLIEIYLNSTSNKEGNKENGHEYVDLGLSVKWATMNIGANIPIDYGGYFAWGETTAKSIYNWSTYKYCNGSHQTLTKYKNNSSYGYYDIDFEDDAAHVKWGGNWRMPTYEELTELKEKCTCTWITQNGVNGCKVIGPNGNSIFLPAAGFYNEGSSIFVGTRGDYWASSLSVYNSAYARCLFFKSNNIDWSSDYRCYGRSIRAVCP